MESYINFAETDDPVVMAIKVFRGSPTNQRCWRWYYNMMCYFEPTIEEADSLFTNWIYDKKRALDVDGTPTENSLHAKCFHRHLRALFYARYGRISFDQYGPHPEKKGKNENEIH